MAPLAQWLVSSLSFATISRPDEYQNRFNTQLVAKPALPRGGSKAAKHGAVACESAICSDIGASILRRGGNAVDATIATVLCVGVIGFYHAGIGGGGFAILRNSKGEYESVDFRERAPAAAYETMYQGNEIGAIIGGLAAGVPGELRGLEYIHKKYGKTRWRDLVMPAVRVARYGWEVNEDLVRYLGLMREFGNATFFTRDPSWATDLAPNGKLLTLGETITRKRYADTLEIIADEGVEPFYSGAIAQSMIKAIKRANGTMTMEDLKDYSLKIRNNSQITYRGYKLTAPSAPTSGTVALHMLKILDGFNDFDMDEKRNISTHRLVEAMKWAYAARTRIGDPDFVPSTYHEEAQMLNITNIEEIRRKISDKKTFPASYYDPDYIEQLDDHGTAQISAADEDGLAISVTSTINTLFGSQIMVPETGIIINNEMDDFSIPTTKNSFGFLPSEANLIRPNKRPLSSVSTIIVESPNGQLYFVTGAAGGSRIPTATVQSIINVIDRNMSTYDALHELRVHDQIHPALTYLEVGFDAGTAQFLDTLGHNVTTVPLGISAVHAVRQLEDKSWEAVGEPRQRNSAGRTV